MKAIHGLAPAYISNLLVVKRKSSYNIRSNSGILLEAPRVKINIILESKYLIYSTKLNETSLSLKLLFEKIKNIFQMELFQLERIIIIF